MRFLALRTLACAVACLVLWGCGADFETRCGPGTELIAKSCLPIEDAAVMVTDMNPVAAADGGTSSCGVRAFLVNGRCQGLQPVGGVCESGGECDSQTCLPEEDGFPGGYCSVPMCNELRPCNPGSHCVYTAKRDRTVCLAFCSGASECREGYVCQPLYEGDINVCIPACTAIDNCPDRTYCDEASGKCLLRECDPKASDPACGENRICYGATRDLTAMGGLCLSTCDPAAPSCQGQDVCQPLPRGDASQAICVPPVCKQSRDCPAGATCSDGVCRPPARCDGDGECGDAATACVGGPRGLCMTKCQDEAVCDAIHEDLVCAQGVVPDKVCLPLGSYPGSACRKDRNSQCDSVATGKTTAPMTCENDKCLIECASGGDASCKAISSNLSCASGVFDRAVCLPSGSYPGGPCAGDQCSDADFGGGDSAKMLCKGGQCLIDCGPVVVGSLEPNAYCAGIGSELICATGAFPGSAVCLPSGSYPGGPCSRGSCSKFRDQIMACVNDTCLVTCTPDNPDTPADEDACGSVDASLACARGVYAQDVCLPKGSFPGSPCGGPNNDQCAQDLNGVAELDMRCVDGRCVIGCSEDGKWEGYGESLCTFADPTLTCAQAADEVCVKACNNGMCSNGFACLDPGTPPNSENACLPNGSFPGAPCGPNDSCGTGPSGSSMSCRNNVCVVNCPPGSDGDTLCSMVSSSLTCADGGGGLCVPACNDGNCESGFSCLSKENACLPDGTFPGAACASGNKCSGSPMLVCVPGQTPRCGLGCKVDNGQSNANQYCLQVADELGVELNTCADLGGGVHVCTR